MATTWSPPPPTTTGTRNPAVAVHVAGAVLAWPPDVSTPSGSPATRGTSADARPSPHQDPRTIGSSRSMKSTQGMRWNDPRILVTADQALSSGTNLITLLIAARLMGPARFATLGVALGGVYLVVSASRAIVGEPLLTFHVADVAGQHDGRIVREAMAASLLIGVIGASVLFAGWFSGLSVLQDCALVAIWAPALSLQDTSRYIAFSEHAPMNAVLSDASWALVEGACFAGLIAGRGLSPATLVLGWGLGATVAMVVGLRSVGASSVSLDPRPWLRRSSRLSGWLGLQAALTQGMNQLMVLILGFTLGLKDLGGLLAMHTVFRPVTGMSPALVAASVPRLVADAELTPAVVRDHSRRTVVTGAPIAAGLIALLVVLSPVLVQVVLGSRFSRYEFLVIPIACGALIQVCGSPAVAGLQALRAGRALFLTSLLAAAVGTAALLFLAEMFGVIGAAWGYGVYGAIVTASVWFALYLFRPPLGRNIAASDPGT